VYIFLLLTTTLRAQVTIGSLENPVAGALLQLKSVEDIASSGGKNCEKGIGFPRVELVKSDLLAPMYSVNDAMTLSDVQKSAHKGLVVYNVAENDAENLGQGLYFWDGAEWLALTSGNSAKEWFYMPSFNLPITATGQGKTFDLYGEYVRQFTAAGNAQFVTNAPSSVTKVRQPYQASQLYYFVTAYPTEVLNITDISDAGVMTYDVISTNIPEGSYVNVIFVVK